MSLVEGNLKPDGVGALGLSPERRIGGWSKVEMALLPSSGMGLEASWTESRAPPIDVTELVVDGLLL